MRPTAAAMQTAAAVFLYRTEICTLTVQSMDIHTFNKKQISFSLRI